MAKKRTWDYNIYKIGDHVQSTYKARWKGVVVDIVESTNHAKHVVHSIPMISGYGNPMRAMRPNVLSPYWLIPTKIKPEHVREDWIVKYNRQKKIANERKKHKNR